MLVTASFVVLPAPGPVQASPSAHTWFLAVVSTPEHVNPLSAAEARELADDAGDYWITEARGEISSFEISEVREYSSPLSCADDLEGEARERFGRALSEADEAAHLVVVIPEACGTTGRGSIGRSTQSGGAVVLSSDVAVMPVLAHEIGHNLSLLHANARFCALGATRLDDCAAREYADSWDLMGLTWTGRTAPAVNAAMLTALGIYDGGPVLAMQPGEGRSAATATLDAIGRHTADASARVVDPRTGETYFVEYRAGEIGARYVDGGVVAYDVGGLQLGEGVRLLRTVGRASEVIATQRVPGGPFVAAARDRGDTVGTPSGSIVVTVARADALSADISIAFDDGITQAEPAPSLPGEPTPDAPAGPADPREPVAPEPVTPDSTSSPAPEVVPPGATAPDAALPDPAQPDAGQPVAAQPLENGGYAGDLDEVIILADVDAAALSGRAGAADAGELARTGATPHLAPAALILLALGSALLALARRRQSTETLPSHG